jgi:hypothetical protein
MTSFPTSLARYVHFDLEVDKDSELGVPTPKRVSSERRVSRQALLLRGSEFVFRLKLLGTVSSFRKVRE